VSVLLILEGPERNAKKKTRKNKKGERRGRGEKKIAPAGKPYVFVFLRP
jgi:hypothetical protein